MKRLLVGILAAGALSGCAGQQLSSTEPVTTFTVARDYQAVFRDLRAYTKSCYETGLITAQVNVDAQLYTDIRKGEIDVTMVGALGRMPQFSIALEPAGQGTMVTIRSRPGVGVQEAAQRIHSAASGARPGC